MAVNYLNKTKKIGEKTAGNRFAILPTESNSAAPGGLPSDKTIDRYKKFAAGGAGLIFCEATAISNDARARVNQLVLTAENSEAFIPLVDAVKTENPDAVFVIQLDHAGALADPSFSKPVAVYKGEEGDTPVLTDAQIEEVRDAFIQSSIAAKKAGFDGVEMKICHGFLGNDFMQPRNTRKGRYGGSFENRARFLIEAVEGIKKATGDEFLIGLRLPAYESIPGGFGTSGPDEVIEDLTEPIEISKMAEKAGVSMISVSAGNASGNLDLIHPTPNYPDGVYRHFGWAAAIRKAVSIPVIGAGYSYLSDGKTGMGSWSYWAEKNLADGRVDFVGLGRQGFADPALPVKLLGGSPDKVNYCTACLGCGVLLGGQKEVKCVVYDA
ncbi:MAG: NADH:flavin oxidoreductase [Spirochaetales bacterium]|nr:NADH:flavin oxidoreductase [Spirochaetales bacterium]